MRFNDIKAYCSFSIQKSLSKIPHHIKKWEKSLGFALNWTVINKGKENKQTKNIKKYANYYSDYEYHKMHVRAFFPEGKRGMFYE